MAYMECLGMVEGWLTGLNDVEYGSPISRVWVWLGDVFVHGIPRPPGPPPFRFGGTGVGGRGVEYHRT